PWTEEVETEEQRAQWLAWLSGKAESPYLKKETEASPDEKRDLETTDAHGTVTADEPIDAQVAAEEPAGVQAPASSPNTAAAEKRTSRRGYGHDSPEGGAVIEEFEGESWMASLGARRA